MANPEIFKKVILKLCPDFVDDEFNRDILNDIYLYANNAKGRLDTHKGIFFWGSIGTGKSTLLKILAEYQRTMDRGFKIINCSSLAASFEENGYIGLDESTHNNGKPLERGFDELGREQIQTYHFSNRLNIMQYILEKRYENMQNAKTYITTNLKPDAIESLYGKYIHDRAIEMFNFLEVKGGSRRK